MITVFDTSALIKHYINETDSDRINTVWDTATLICVSWITEAEMFATFARKRRESVISPSAIDSAEHRFLADWPTFTAIEPHRVSSLLPTLHRAHILRGADSIQLATALVARSLAQGEEIIFATADERLAKAAKDEGLTIIP